MTCLPALTRWRIALAHAARRSLAARCRSTLEALEAARTEYRRMHCATAVDAGALRKAAQRVRALEQLRAALARELHVQVLPLSPESPDADAVAG